MCHPAQLLRVRYHTHADKTRVVFDLSSLVPYHVQNDNKRRLDIRFFKCTIRSQKRLWRIRDGRISDVHVSETLNGAQVEIGLQTAVLSQTFTLGNPDRIVVDFFTTNQSNRTGLSKSSPSTILSGRIDFDTLIKKAVAERQQTPRSKRRIRRIVIDPGHGGFDSGAVNKRMGLSEKDFTLPISLALKQVIGERSNGAIEVFLTRTDDYYVTLSDRVVTANQYDADLFISIHCNANEDAKASGFEVYFSAPKASDREAEKVAQRENALALTDPFFHESDAIDIESILKNLQRRRHLKASQSYAATVHHAVGRSVSIKRRPVKSANFFVLRFAQMPAILVETAFITNSSDAKLLKSPRFHREIAEAIYESVQQWNQ